jgi:hypothetical protein
MERAQTAEGQRKIPLKLCPLYNVESSTIHIRGKTCETSMMFIATRGVIQCFKCMGIKTWMLENIKFR